MNETTRIVTAEITTIFRHEGDAPEVSKEEYAKGIQEALGADNVVVTNIQHFTQEHEPDPMIRAIAEKLNGIGYGENISEIEKEAKENGIVIVMGASDDLMEFSGAIEDEGSCYEGGTVYFDRDGVSQDDSERDNVIEAVWCGMDDENGIEATWGYRTDIPHETFKVFDDGELYCLGIVFSIKDVR